ncbi:MAG TPA: GNAT family protein [Terriglobales bacterium]|jgi:RimJ/RimL family protein N-acetyltransferase|nr:GNAT family protein [Terriglobales bacterium]
MTQSLPAPFLLEGTHVRLEPLRPEHAPLLWEIVRDHLDDMFRWIPYRLQSLQDFEAFNRQVAEEVKRGVSLPFATLERGSGKVVGTTRYMNMDLPNRKVEIGSTWIAPPWQRTVINTEAKYLMLIHAFESWKCLRVELKTDSMNQRSRQAILRLGAKEEGTLRKHMLTWNGRQRDSVYFSILDTEWAGVKAELERKLQS